MFACNWYIIGAALLLSATSLSIADEPAAEKAKPKTVKVAAIQCSSDLGDIAGNRKKLTALIKEAAGEGAKIVVLPETSITGYSTWDLLSSFGNS